MAATGSFHLRQQPGTRERSMYGSVSENTCALIVNIKSGTSCGDRVAINRHAGMQHFEQGGPRPCEMLVLQPVRRGNTSRGNGQQFRILVMFLICRDDKRAVNPLTIILPWLVARLACDRNGSVVCQEIVDLFGRPSCVKSRKLFRMALRPSAQVVRLITAW